MRLCLGLFAMLACVLCAGPASVAAHGALFTYKYINGNNLVMVTHNVQDTAAGLPITYNLRLYTIDGRLIDFETAHAEIWRGNRIIDKLTATASKDQDANLTYTYPGRGTYTLVLRFLDHDKQIAYGEFPIAASAALNDSLIADASTPATLVALACGLVVGAAGVLLYQKGRQSGTLGRGKHRLQKK